MYYYEVLVASPKYQKDEPLTYGSKVALVAGAVVEASLQGQAVVATVVKRTSEPSFKVLGLQLVLDTPLPGQSLKLINWLRDYYPGPSGITHALFLPKFLLGLGKKHRVGKPGAAHAGTKVLPALTQQQQDALKTIDSAPVAILHGDTGSGKTRVYAELARQVLSRGEDVLVLTPEIGLTPQLTDYFKEHFGNRVFIVHSGLTESERRTVWTSVIEHKEPCVVIGTRSALFLPFTSLGLVIVDEFHDNSYKNEGQPRYDGRRVASMLARLHDAQIVFGSATPPVSDYFIAHEKSVPVARISGRAIKTQHDYSVKLVSVLDRSHFKANGHISDDLIEAIRGALQRGEQSLVFLNRRGTARTVLCDSCGWQAMCPKCDVPLTYHGDNHSYQCHTCGHQEKPRSYCPVCHNNELVYKGIGTKGLITALEKLFPQATIRRFDTDSKKADRLESHFQDVVKGKVDILVGTQVIAKGLDLPKLGVVGVVSADTSLAFPDYTAEEKTYQLLVQIIGRVGRGHRPGSVVVQTVRAESSVITAAVNADWHTFYQRELVERQKYIFPPYCYLLKLSCARKTQSGAERAAQELVERIRSMRLSVQIMGPSPAFHAKTGTQYVWQLVVKAKDRSRLIAIVQILPSGWSYDLDPSTLL